MSPRLVQRRDVTVEVRALVLEEPLDLFGVYGWELSWFARHDTGQCTGLFLFCNVAQSSFSNWAAGGQNSVALNGLINLSASYSKDKNA